MQFQREILDAIRRILRALRESSRAAEADLGLSGAQLLVLQTLNSTTSLSINELAVKTQTHQSSVSAVVTKLEEAQLVRRVASAEDRRRVEVVLTPGGNRIVKTKTKKLAHQKLFAAIDELSQTKQKQLALLLTELVENAGFADEPATLFFEDEKERSK